MKENVLVHIMSSLQNYNSRNAFCINEIFYTYDDFAKCISKIRGILQKQNFAGKNIGIVANDDLETYASIIALWFEGLAYVPLHPLQPQERNLEIIAQAEIDLVLSTDNIYLFQGVKQVETGKLAFESYLLEPKEVDDSDLTYILFTSGSTGKPKGVPITRENIAAFVKSFWDLGYIIDENDRFLQPFDLTFDLSVISYLIPIIKGACVYTVPHDQIKYSYIAELLEEHKLTFALMVPSTIRYLRPYFDEINLPNLKYSQFCGEGLPLDLTEEWSKCVPNAFIDNVYGPTEDTIYCSFYRFLRNENNKSYNGTLCIGKPMTSGDMIIVGENDELINYGEQGELCLTGKQLTPGYWRNEEQNKKAFFEKKYNGKTQIFYRTGDLCFMDNDGDFLYVGRKDSQAKIQGYRIELGEIEFHAREYLNGVNVVVLTFENNTGNTELAMFIEGNVMETSDLINHMRSKMPVYMIPSKVLFEQIFPLNANGKTDRKILKSLIK